MTQTARADEHVVTSPSGNHAVRFTLSEGRLYYSVSHGAETILSDSRLSLTLDGDDLRDDFQIDGICTDSKSGKWTPVVGSRSSYPEAYHEKVIHLSETTGSKRRLDLEFRAYDEGIAFRYTIPKQAGLADITLLSEDSEFQFTDDHYVYWDDYPQARYSKVKISAMGECSTRPLLVEAGSHFVAIAEAGSLEHYAPMALSRNGRNRLVTSFRRGTVTGTAPMSTSWKVVMASDKPGTLVENHYLLQNLSPPNAIGDTSWIKPGKCWRSDLSTEAAKAIINCAVDNDYQYVHYDAGWYGHERDARSNPVTVKPGIDMKEVIRYANDRGIGLICYINKVAMSGYDLEDTFRTYEEWGISGVKLGFVDWEDQSDMEFLYAAIRTAAKYHLVVDIHDNFRLTGIERSYPNLLTVEGILGNEERASKDNSPKNVLTTSFARMIAGAGDFTPCYLDRRVVSRAFQLALGVVFYSPLQYLHWYDQADKYAGRSFPELEFWKEMPTTWDDSRVIHGEIGEYMTVARRSGDAWFIGTITDDARNLDIPLSFLGSGAYTATVYKEDPANEKYVAIETIDVTSDSTVTASMSPGSGHAIWLRPDSAVKADQELGLRSDGGVWKFYPAQEFDERLPRTLLIGDSIMNGYRNRVIAGLKGQANVDCWLTPMRLNSDKLELVRGDRWHWQGNAYAIMADQVVDAVADARNVTIHPAPEGIELSDNFAVSVAGMNVPVYKAKVPPFEPIPRLTNYLGEPGIASFVTFDMRTRIDVTVTCPEPVESVKILPTSFGITPKVEGRKITFTLDEPKHLTVEVNGDWHESLHIFSNPIEEDIPRPDDPNVVYFGPGIHEVTSLTVKDNTTVYVAGGAYLRCVVDPDEKPVEMSGRMRNPPTFILQGKNIVFRGRGIIDQEAISRANRRYTILVQDSEDVTLEGVVIHDPSHWTIPIKRSGDVHVDNIKIIGRRGNADGVDISSSCDVLVENCFLRTLDDLVVVKSRTGQGEVKNVHARKCVLWNELAHALSVGAEVRENVSDVLFEDCDVIHDVGRETALRVYHCDDAIISNVTFQNIRIEEARRLISCWIGRTRWTKTEERGHIKGVTFRNITATSAPIDPTLTGFQDGTDWKPYVIKDHASMEIVGYDQDHIVEDVLFDNVILDGKKVTVKNVTINEFAEAIRFK